MKLTNEELIARAEKAGWTWVENFTTYPFGSKEYPATGWLETEDRSCFHNARKTETGKVDILLGDATKPVSGFNHNHDCCMCGKPIWLMYMEDREKKLIERKECFKCNHWMELVRGKTSRCAVMLRQEVDTIVVADKVAVDIPIAPGTRHHYMIEESNDKFPHWNNGFGGTKFKIKFTDGRVVETNNLWHQGQIPERFWDLLPVNAEFTHG